MPIDPVQMRKIIDHNDEVVKGVHTMTNQLAKLDARPRAAREAARLETRNYEEASANVRKWAKNVHELKDNLVKQQDLTKAMREEARIEDEQHGDSFYDKLMFVVDRLKADVRFFFFYLQEYIDLPHDVTRTKTWDHYIHVMEMDIKKIGVATATDSWPASFDTIVSLLNFRDAVMSLLLDAILYQKAVLDWDLKSSRTYADKPMVDMFDLVANYQAKTETVPARLISEVPSLSSIGPFSYVKQQKRKDEGTTSGLSQLESRLLAVLREMQSLDSGMRNMKFGQQVTIEEEGTGKIEINIAPEDLRKEVTAWFKKCGQLEAELQTSKAQRHTPWEKRVEELTRDNREKDREKKELHGRLSKLESEVQNLRNELQLTRRSRDELAEKNARYQKEHAPQLTQMEKLLSKSREAVEILTADAEQLSSMFKEQLKDNKASVEKHEETAKDLANVKRQLKLEVRKNNFKEEELQKKETLYIRTMAARKSIHDAYLEQKAKITEVETKMQEREKDWQEMLKVVQGRDSEIRNLHEELQRAHNRIAELETQKKRCMAEFQQATGKPMNMLLDQVKAMTAAANAGETPAVATPSPSGSLPPSRPPSHPQRTSRFDTTFLKSAA